MLRVSDEPSLSRGSQSWFVVEWMGRHLFLELIDQNIYSISPKLLVGLKHVALQGHLIKISKVTHNT